MPAYSLRRLLWAGPVATATAILVNILYHAITRALGEQYLLPLDEKGTTLGPMPATMIVTTILVTGLAATILFGLLIRFAHKPKTVFLSVAITALILSFGGPLGLPTASAKTKILLSGMHVIAAVIIAEGILLLSKKRDKIP